MREPSGKKQISVIVVLVEHDKDMPENLVKQIEHKVFDAISAKHGEQAIVTSKLVSHHSRVSGVNLQTIVSLDADH